MARAYKVKGLDNLQRKLEKLPEQIKQATREKIEDAADTIVLKAVSRAPVDLGVLRQSIGNEPRNGGFNYIIFVSAEYAPYIEFGTGIKVNVPSELTNYAKQFIGKGERQVNLPARPFLFPAYFEERKKLIEDLKKSIGKYL